MALTACQWKQPSHVDSCAQEAAGARREERGERKGPLFSILLLISINVLIFLQTRCIFIPPKFLGCAMFVLFICKSTTEEKTNNKSLQQPWQYLHVCLFSVCLFLPLPVESNHVVWNVPFLCLCPILTHCPEATVHFREMDVRVCVCWHIRGEETWNGSVTLSNRRAELPRCHFHSLEINHRFVQVIFIGPKKS